MQYRCDEDGLMVLTGMHYEGTTPMADHDGQ